MGVDVPGMHHFIDMRGGCVRHALAGVVSEHLLHLNGQSSRKVLRSGSVPLEEGKNFGETLCVCSIHRQEKARRTEKEEYE
jgi:hypothetical protein